MEPHEVGWIMFYALAPQTSYSGQRIESSISVGGLGSVSSPEPGGGIGEWFPHRNSNQLSKQAGLNAE